MWFYFALPNGDKLGKNKRKRSKMAVIIVQTRGGDIEVPTPLPAMQANKAIQSQLFDKELTFLCVENHAFAKTEVLHVLVETEEDEELPQSKHKEEETCYMD